MTAESQHHEDALEQFLLLCADASRNPPSNWHKIFDKVVVAASKVPLDDLEVEVATRFAVAIWYFSDAMTDSLEQRLLQPGLAPVRKRRLMYLVDRLRRFPVMEPSKASQMKSFVNHWHYLTSTADAHVVRKAEKVNRYDKVAVTWGLAENVSGLMSKVLEFQTRHFVDKHALPSGYSELSLGKVAVGR